MQNYSKITDLLTDLNLKSFLSANGNTDYQEFVLSSDFDKPLKFLLAEQLRLYPKAKKKLPTFASHFCFFTAKSFEQSSSEELALFKFFHRKDTKEQSLIIDLSGGLGVDDWAFSKKFKQVISVDSDTELNILARKNFELLNAKNISRIDDTAENFIQHFHEKADWVYIDADRRSETKKAVHLFEGSPDIPFLLQHLPRITQKTMLKLSPLIDLTHITKNLPACYEIRVVSFQNEVKEILALLDFSFVGEAKTIAVDIKTHNDFNSFTAKTQGRNETYKTEGKYFYEPALCIIKAGLTADYAAEKNLFQISAQTQYLTGDTLVEDFMGRSFEMKTQLPFSKKTVNEYLQSKRISKANIAKRNFPTEVAELKKTFKLQDGGDDYLFFATDQRKQKWFWHCTKPC